MRCRLVFGVQTIPDPMSYLDMYITNGSQNKTGYANPKYDELIKKQKQIQKIYKLAGMPIRSRTTY